MSLKPRRWESKELIEQRIGLREGGLEKLIERYPFMVDVVGLEAMLAGDAEFLVRAYRALAFDQERQDRYFRRLAENVVKNVGSRNNPIPVQ